MRTTALLTISFVAACAANAQLHYNASAALSDHMREVNAQWQEQGIVPPDATAAVQFTSEAERIATHLRLVHQTLRQRSMEGLSAEQQKNRIDLLDELGIYAEAGTFPQNYVLPYRNPVFIDPHGTACAVGQLMIESGHRDLAERIDREMETAYLFEILESERAGEVAAWATEHGFSAEELAWIQPGYPPPYTWTPVGGGTNGPVTVTLKLASGDLLVAGEFTQAGGTSFNKIAIWDGATYTSLGSGLNGTITTAVEFNGDIYVGGSGFNGMSDLARWNGSTWSYYTIFEGKWPMINTLHVHDNILYAGGEAMGFAGADHEVRRVNNDFTYTTVGSRFNGRVLDLETYFGFLIAGGEFTGLETSTDPLVAHIAQLEGNEWGQFLEGTDAPVRVLMTDGNDLYIGGDLFVNIAVTFGLAKITNMGSEIEELLPNHADYIFPGNGPTYISSLAMNGDDLYFGGVFYMGVGTIMGNNLGIFEGAPDSASPMIVVEAPVRALATKDNKLYVGGEFSQQYAHFVSLDLTTSIRPEPGTIELSIHPNPAIETVVLTNPQGERIDAIRVLDAAGREVLVPMTRNHENLRLEVKALSAGTYTIQSISNGQPATARFIKQ